MQCLIGVLQSRQENPIDHPHSSGDNGGEPEAARQAVKLPVSPPSLEVALPVKAGEAQAGEEGGEEEEE